MRLCLAFSAFLFGFGSAFAAKLPSSLEREVKACQKSFTLLKAQKYAEASHVANSKNCPTVASLASYLALKQDDSKASFEDYTHFIKAHGTWPWIFVLKKKAEHALNEGTPTEALFSWFRTHPPQTAKGVIAYGEILLKVGKTGEATTFLKKAYVTTKLSEKKEQLFLSKFQKFLRPSDYAARAKRLINDHELESASKLLSQVSGEDRSYLKTRIALRQGRDSVESLIRPYLKTLKNDLDLALDYLRWLRQKGHAAFSKTLASLKPLVVKHPQLFWKERHIGMRDALLEGKVQEAFSLGISHGLQGGEDYFEAEWLLGWIALRHLNKPNKAISHFLRLETMVKKPQTLSKVHYWLARAYEAQENKAKAKAFYGRAAQHPATYYGQLAARKIGKEAPSLKITPAKASPKALREMEKHTFIKVIRLLHEAGLDDEILPFVYLLAKSGLTHDQELAVFQIAHQIAPHHGLVVEQKSTHINGIPYQESYPVLTGHEKKVLECEDKALVHSVIRQESRFNPLGKSSAGACGLMQLMPKTAQIIAAKKNLKVTQTQLLTNPRLNLKLGSSYLQEQLEAYQGQKEIALAAYNAGPGNAAKWLKTIGDPREGFDVVDWIESLPFKETRGYIMHVLANYGIYKRMKI